MDNDDETPITGIFSNWFIPPLPPMHEQIFHCDLTEARVKHESHFWEPEFTRGETGVPDFVCGGYPRKIIDIEEARDRH